MAAELTQEVSGSAGTGRWAARRLNRAAQP